MADDATSPQLIFHSQRQPIAVDAVDGDDIGLISFNGYDDGTPSTQTYATILSEVSDSATGAEKGKLTVGVAANNGTVVETLTLIGQASTNTVNVGINDTTPLSPLSVGGAMSLPVRLDTGTTQLLGVTDYCLIVANGSTSTVTLPQLSTVGDGRLYRIISHQAGLVIDGHSSETIMGATTFVVDPANWIDLISYNTGTDWKIVGKGTIA